MPHPGSGYREPLNFASRGRRAGGRWGAEGIRGSAQRGTMWLEPGEGRRGDGGGECGSTALPSPFFQDHRHI